jgi:DNA-binding transcriptional LysR family regulator
VVDAGSFTGAARMLGQPKTTVSRRIASLEAALGSRLLQRTTRSLALTDAGRRYYGECREALAAIDAANRDVGHAQAEPSGTIRISAPADAGGYFLFDAVADFLTRYPHVKAEVILTDERLNLIEARIDVAFRAGPLEDSTLVARRLSPAHHVFCASPRYLAEASTPRKPADLRDHDCIVLRGTIEGAQWVVYGPEGSETVPVRGRLAANAMHFVMRAAIAGLGIARLPAPLAARDIRAGRLRAVLDGYHAGPGGMYAVYPSSRHLSAAVKALIETAARRFAAMPEIAAA